MILTVESPRGSLVFAPQERAGGVVAWQCSGGAGVRPSQLPSACREDDGDTDK